MLFPPLHWFLFVLLLFSYCHLFLRSGISLLPEVPLFIFLTHFNGRFSSIHLTPSNFFLRILPLSSSFSFAKPIFHPQSKTLRHLLESGTMRVMVFAGSDQDCSGSPCTAYSNDCIRCGRGPRPAGWSSYRFSCVPTRFKSTLTNIFF